MGNYKTGPNTIIRHGFLGIFVRTSRTSECDDSLDYCPPQYHVERLWLFPLELTFSDRVVASQQIRVNGTINLADEQFKLGGFQSFLSLWDEGYTAQRGNFKYTTGEQVYVKHQLKDHSANLDLVLDRVWFSTSADPEDRENIKFEVTARFTRDPADEKSAVWFDFTG